MKLLGISGTIVGSKICAITQKALDEVTKNESELETELLDLKQYDMQLCDGRSYSEYNADTKKIIDIVTEADMYIIGTPIFHSSIPGALKNLLDLMPTETFYKKVMGFITVADNYRHHLVVENQLKPIASYFQAYAVPQYVFALSNDFNQKNELVNEEIKKEISKLARDICYLQRKLKL